MVENGYNCEGTAWREDCEELREPYTANDLGDRVSSVNRSPGIIRIIHDQRTIFSSIDICTL